MPLSNHSCKTGAISCMKSQFPNTRSPSSWSVAARTKLAMARTANAMWSTLKRASHRSNGVADHMNAVTESMAPKSVLGDFMGSSSSARMRTMTWLAATDAAAAKSKDAMSMSASASPVDAGLRGSSSGSHSRMKARRS